MKLSKISLLVATFGIVSSMLANQTFAYTIPKPFAANTYDLGEGYKAILWALPNKTSTYYEIKLLHKSKAKWMQIGILSTGPSPKLQPNAKFPFDDSLSQVFLWPQKNVLYLVTAGTEGQSYTDFDIYRIENNKVKFVKAIVGVQNGKAELRSDHMIIIGNNVATAYAWNGDHLTSKKIPLQYTYHANLVVKYSDNGGSFKLMSPQQLTAKVGQTVLFVPTDLIAKNDGEIFSNGGYNGSVQTAEAALIESNMVKLTHPGVYRFLITMDGGMQYQNTGNDGQFGKIVTITVK